LCAVAASPTTARAHGADANTADIRLAGDTAYVVVWPPSRAFTEFDDNHDSLIQPAETRAHRQAMLERFHRHFSLEDDAGRTGEMIFEDLSTPMAAAFMPTAGADHLRVTLRLRWQKPPAWLALRYTLYAGQPMIVHSARVTASKVVSEQKLLTPLVHTVFDREHPSHRLLEPPVPPHEP
jgi:hypothetical protein